MTGRAGLLTDLPSHDDLAFEREIGAALFVLRRAFLRHGALPPDQLAWSKPEDQKKAKQLFAPQKERFDRSLRKLRYETPPHSLRFVGYQFDLGPEHDDA